MRSTFSGLAATGAVAIIVLCSSSALGQPPRANPPRDQRPAVQTGTAAIRGRVLAGDTGRPLRRVRITVSAPELGTESRTTSTDSSGRYEITDLPAGRYTLRVSRSGYLTLRYGQRRPLEQGKPLQVLDKQIVEDVDFSLPRMGLITGRVTDEAGDPIEGVSVYALRSMYYDGARQLVPTGGGQFRTDDAGQYRVLNLAPGTYYVTASTRDTWTVNHDGVREVMGFAPTYFPGTTRIIDARRVTVALGRETSNMDFALVPGRAAKVSGTAFDSRGRPFQNVNLRQEVRGDDFASFGSAGSASVAGDGRFTIMNVPPGTYKLTANVGRDSTEPEVAILPIVVDGVDIDDLVLTGSTGGTVTGQVITEDGGVPNIPRIRISITDRTTGQTDPVILGSFRNPGNSDVKTDGTFAINGVFGRSRLRVTLPDGWAVKAVLHEAQDLADVPIELRSGETLSGVQVIVTNRVTTVAGRLTDANGVPVSDGTVIVFIADAQKRSEESRWVRSARPDQEGQWRITGLPPGDYLAVAVDYVEDGMWNEPEYLESIRQYGQKVTLTAAGSETVALKLIQNAR